LYGSPSIGGRPQTVPYRPNYLQSLRRFSFFIF
jgi:hypothetical protein